MVDESKVTLSYVISSRDDIDYHLEQLKPAFVGSATPKAEWSEMAARIKSNHAALYQAKGAGVRLRFVGQVIDGSYHINAMVGTGMLDVCSLIIDHCKNMGYQSITFATYRTGMGRFLAGFGFVYDGDGSDGEQKYLLDIGGFNG